MNWLDPQFTYLLLLIVQAVHLLHHRLAKRHISFVEGVTGVVLCVPPTLVSFGTLLAVGHLLLAAIQIVGSIWIKRLSPEWK